MTNKGETQQYADPEGSIFLRKRERKLQHDQFALLLGRGDGAGLSLEEQIARYEANKQALEALRQKVAPEMATVALASET